MDARQRDVLIALIRQYIDSAQPVGSRILAKRYFKNLSPATIRNAMADLEDMGYLAQPHTSAGRVPTRARPIASTWSRSRRRRHRPPGPASPHRHGAEPSTA